MAQWLKDIAKEMDIASLPESYQDIAVIIGLEATLQLSEYLGGSRFYFRKIEGLLLDKRDQRIRQDFTGDNHAELARYYNLTETRIRTILHGKRLVQCGLFEENKVISQT